MFDVLGLVLPLFGLIGLGYITARITGQPLNEMGWLNTFIIYLALPALFFRLLAKTPIEELANWHFLSVSIGVTFVIYMLAFVIGLVLSGGRMADATIIGLASAYGNIGYMGIAISLLALGEKAAIPVALIFCFENVMHFIIAPAFMAISGQRKQSLLALLGTVVRQILFHPFILATIAGIAAAASGFASPAPLERLIGYLAQAAAPCALFALGVSLALRPLARVPRALFFIVPIKLVLHPIAAYLMLSYVGNFEPIWVYTAVLLAALPTATNVFVIAEQYGVWVERASASVFVTTLFSVATVSLLLYAITSGWLPADYFPEHAIWHTIWK